MTVPLGPLLLANRSYSACKVPFGTVTLSFQSAFLFVISSDRSESRNLFAVDGADGKAGVAVGVGVELGRYGAARAGKERGVRPRKVHVVGRARPIVARSGLRLGGTVVIAGELKNYAVPGSFARKCDGVVLGVGDRGAGVI